MTTRPILIIGRHGQVARALIAIGGERIEALGRDACDLTDPVRAAAEIAARRPLAVINAAAYTAVDAAETDVATAMTVNRDAPAALAEAAARSGAPFVHLSTDYVFDGEKRDRYVEDDPTAPLNVYGRSKREGEQAVLAVCPHAVIARTSWVHAPIGRNFVRTVLALARTRDELRIVSDQIGAPTSADEIAQACLSIVDARLSGVDGEGIHHLTCAGETSWAGFAEAILNETAAWRGGRSPTVTPIPSSEYPTPARRPLDTRLDCSRVRRTFGVAPAHWREGLARTLAALKNEFTGEAHT